MNILFDDNTKNALLKSLEKQNKTAIRLTIKGFGWGGPILDVALDEPQADDETCIINNVKFVFEPDSSYLFDGAKIIYSKSIFGKNFSVIPAVEDNRC